ncbi:hypothetical protein Trydic_g20234, partial [Trypoxylus dichotomus]
LLTPTIINYFMFLMSYNANSINDLLQYRVGLEISKQFKNLNQNIRSTPLSNGTIQNVMDNLRRRMKLLRLSARFNELCTLPLLLTLAFQCMLSIWVLHSAFVMIVFKLPHHKLLLLLIFIRMGINAIYAVVIFGMWASIQEEV